MAKKINDKTILATLLSTKSIKESAELLGITEQTIHNRLKKGLREKLEEEQAQVLSVAVAKNQNLTSRALSELEKILDDENTTTPQRISAIKVILDNGIKLTDMQVIAKRMDELEETLADIKNDQ